MTLEGHRVTRTFPSCELCIVKVKVKSGSRQFWPVIHDPECSDLQVTLSGK